MSDYEHQRGRMIKVVAEDGITLHQHCLNILKDNNLEYNGFHDNPAQMLADEFYNEYLYLQGELYKILEINDEDPYDSFAHITSGDNGELLFNSRYYNGGTCLSEMLDDALNRLNKDNETKRDS